jgi:hypothetical protein
MLLQAKADPNEVWRSGGLSHLENTLLNESTLDMFLAAGLDVLASAKAAEGGTLLHIMASSRSIPRKHTLTLLSKGALPCLAATNVFVVYVT